VASIKEDGPAAIIPHQHIDTPAILREVVHQFFFDKQLDPLHLEAQILPLIIRLADPTDRALNSPSSTGHRGSVKNTHAAAALSNEASIEP
jgi:hypothetical protein